MAFTPNQDENRVARLDGLFKEIYADNLENLLPKGLKLQKDIGWIEKSKSPGGTYHQPVLLRHEHGFTYAQSGSGAFALADAVPGKTDDTTILGTQMMLRSVIDYEVAARASSGGKRTFRRALDIVVENMFASTRKRMECDYFYAQSPLCEIYTATDSGADDVVKTTQRSWAPGLWAGMEDVGLDAFKDHNTDTELDAAIDSADNDNGEDLFVNQRQSVPKASETLLFQNKSLKEVDVQNRTITIAGTDALSGDASHDTAPAVNTVSHWITYTGQWATSSETQAQQESPNVFTGMKAIMDPRVATTGAAGGTLFGLDTAANSLWQGNVVRVTDETIASTRVNQKVLEFSHIANQIAIASAKGLDENLVMYLNPLVWTDLILQEKENVQWNNNAGGKGYDLGGDDIRFHTANGVVNIKPSNYVKIGDGFMFAPKLWKRIGATDLTFRLPDRGDEFFLHLPSHAGYELRNYVSHALFTKAPAKSIYLSDIRLTADAI